MFYNYIFICSGVHHLNKKNDNYYAICARDLEKCENVHLVYDIVDRVPKPIRFLFELHHSRHINRIIELPFKDFWIPYYFKNPFDNKKPLCVVFQNWVLPIKSFNYYENKYPGFKKVKIHRDIIKDIKTLHLYDGIFDFSLTYDKDEAQKYDYVWFEEYESKLDDLTIVDNYPECDVFFAGLVKDRLPKLMTIYKKLTEAGLKVHYYLLGVPKDKQEPLEGITYGRKYLSYREMLERTINSRCVLDVNQKGAVGYTSRILEAIIYNKPLIADNPIIKTSKFYNPDYIQVYDDWNYLDPEFVKKDETRVNYHYNGEFSPVRLIEQIDAELVKRFGK